MKELLIILSLATVITVVVLFSVGIFGHKKKDVSTVQSVDPKLDQLDDPAEVRKQYGLPPGENYLLPAEFKVGLIKQDKPFFMNNCNPNVLYPINGLGPDYGWKMPDDCRCTEFVRAP